MTNDQYLKEFIGIEHLPEIGDPAAYGKAVLTVLGADGQISDKEKQHFLDHARRMGFPQVILSDLETFDCRNSRFEEFVAAVRQSSVGEMLLYDAITGSMVDEYAEGEQQAVTKAANTLGVDEKVVRAIEGLARIEFALRSLQSVEGLDNLRQAVRAARIALVAPKVAELDVHDIAQAKRFHSQRTGLQGKDVIPVDFVDSVSRFRDSMDRLERAATDGSQDPQAIGEQVAQSCQAFHDDLRRAVADHPDIEAAIGAYGFRETFPYFMLSQTCDRAYTKPRGYSGDYGTMELLYENSPMGEGPLGAFVDTWALDIAMARAVRNRRRLLTDAIISVYDQWTGDGLMPVTSLASGSAREVFDVFAAREKPRIRITCADIDPEVYSYAAAIAEEVGAVENTVFLQDNILKMIFGRGKTILPPQQMIYAVGLIDYLKDRELTALLNWVYDRLLPGGSIVIGQFHTCSPDRPFLDHIIDWILYYRTEDLVRNLFAKSKFGSTPIDVQFEDAGAQMFISCRKDEC